MLGPYFNPLKKDYGVSTNKGCYICGCKPRWVSNTPYLILINSFKFHNFVYRDGHTHWVMDIQPYPIQLFWVIPNS